MPDNAQKFLFIIFALALASVVDKASFEAIAFISQRRYVAPWHNATVSC